jgi:hypothetical protein
MSRVNEFLCLMQKNTGWQGLERRGNENEYLMSMKFLFAVLKLFINYDSGDSCTILLIH